MEFIIMVVVMIWGVIITIIVVSVEYDRWKRCRDNELKIANHDRRLLKLENSKYLNYGQGQKTKEGEETSGTSASTDQT